MFEENAWPWLSGHRGRRHGENRPVPRRMPERTSSPFGHAHTRARRRARIGARVPQPRGGRSMRERTPSAGRVTEGGTPIGSLAAGTTARRGGRQGRLRPVGRGGGAVVTARQAGAEEQLLARARGPRARRAGRPRRSLPAAGGGASADAPRSSQKGAGAAQAGLAMAHSASPRLDARSMRKTLRSIRPGTLDRVGASRQAASYAWSRCARCSFGPPSPRWPRTARSGAVVIGRTTRPATTGATTAASRTATTSRRASSRPATTPAREASSATEARSPTAFPRQRRSSTSSARSASSTRSIR